MLELALARGLDFWMKKYGQKQKNVTSSTDLLSRGHAFWAIYQILKFFSNLGIKRRYVRRFLKCKHSHEKVCQIIALYYSLGQN
jgi:hypothetical protein